MSDLASVKRILILAANPQGTMRLRLDQEVREIEAGLQRSQYRDRFELKSQWAVRPPDIQQAFLNYQPHIVHFCGHGTGVEGLVFEDNTGQEVLVGTQALADLFRLFADQVECVLLNACYSEVQADAISTHIDAVIGMNQSVGDLAALEFAVSFYKALGAGRPVKFAYELGQNAIQLAGIPEHLTPVLKQKNHSVKLRSARVFISYKRDVEPDHPLALEIFEGLQKQHQVFIDQKILVGAPWAAQIEAEIRQSDALIVLLSEQSIFSEMVQAEIALAHEVAKQQNETPVILPVRVAYRQPFQYPLSAYLDSINWAFWQGPEDTPRLVAELHQAIVGGALAIDTMQSKAKLLQVSSPVSIPCPVASAQPKPIRQIPTIPLELPEGTMDAESQFYITRVADPIALSTIQQRGVTITIKGPRQMGKSSLLIRTMDAAVQAGKKSIFLDFQLFDKAVLKDADQFFPQFCVWLTDELDLEDRVNEFWQRPLGNS